MGAVGRGRGRAGAGGGWTAGSRRGWFLRAENLWETAPLAQNAARESVRCRKATMERVASSVDLWYVFAIRLPRVFARTHTARARGGRAWLHPPPSPDLKRPASLRLERPSSFRLDRDLHLPASAPGSHASLRVGELHSGVPGSPGGKLHTSVTILRGERGSSGSLDSTGSAASAAGGPASPKQQSTKTILVAKPAPPALPPRKTPEDRVHAVLDDARTRVRFRHFLEATHSEENVDF